MKKIIIKLKNKIIDMLKQNQYDSVSYGKEPAFALANVIIILTFIAVVIALAAPILSRPSNIDEKNLIKKLDEKEFYVANGDAQVFNVGTESNNMNRNKMFVRGRMRVIGDNSRIRIDENGFNIIQVERTGDYSDDSIITVDNPTRTDIDPSDGHEHKRQLLLNISPTGTITGLNIAPEYNNTSVVKAYMFTESSGYYPKRDGYILYANVLVPPDDLNKDFSSTILDKNHKKTKKASNDYNSLYSGNNSLLEIKFNENMMLTKYPILVPVQQGQKYICKPNSYTGNEICYFIPLADTYNQTQIYGTTIAASP